MTRSRGSLRAALVLALVAAATTWAATLSWRGFTEESADYIGPLLVLGATVAVSGAVARWFRVPGALVVLLQVLLSGMLACLMLTGSPLPVGPAWAELEAAFRTAVTSANRYEAPVPATAPGVHPLLVGGGLLCILLVDLLACTLRRVPLAGLPLLTVYSVPVSVIDASISWWVFALTAAGFMTMLFLQESELVARWGRPLGQQVEGGGDLGVRTGAIRTSAGTIGGVATALAIAVPLLIPTLDLHVFDLGRGSGGSDEISIRNPMVDLRRDLRRGEDTSLIRVETDDPDPSYLRISVLNRFSGDEWSSGDREVPQENRPDGALPALEGVGSAVPRRYYEYDLSIDESFDSTWLPTQAPIVEIFADGDWRYDTRTMDFLAGNSGDDDLTTAGMDYSMTGAQLDLEAAELARAGSGITNETLDFVDLPEDLPAVVRDLAFDVTENATTTFEKAQALQRWFREAGGFEYDLEAADEGSSGDDLAAFLDPEEGRVGYCEQFAAAMATMARVLDIPARVALGFLEPEDLGDGVFEYSAHDLHAWPELFFPGAGWVRFEPTPPDRADAAPDYTTENVPDVQDPSVPPSATASEDTPDRATEAPTTQAPVEEEATADREDEGSGFPWLRLLGGGGGLLVLAALVLTPRLLRGRARERRLAGGPEDVWAELRATAVDLGLSWPRS
ncbi:transglutaminaseTgpA domain-containing protein, partial [Nocardioides lijunqiniae]|uniref:transglutaminase family protein n=1 Tax=Nocardioides lijunqiniae TaxID=2760832 RepID=UPI00187883C0